jgi:hypothetical protein
MKSKMILRRSIRNWTLLFIGGLVLSGITAFALESELAWLNVYFFRYNNSFSFWIHKVFEALRDTNLKYPFLTYGYDWLAFGNCYSNLT